MQNEESYTSIFEKSVRKKGWTFERATPREDMFDHVDGYVTIYNGKRPVTRFSVDLKGTKYISKRHRGNPNCLCQFIEFINVNGDKGWLFGKSQYIAVLDESEERFYMIPRKVMIKFCEKLFNIRLNKKFTEIVKDLKSLDLFVDASEKAHHKLFQRVSRSDLVTQISMEEVRSMAILII
jgi:hypothetical protein